SMLFCYFQQISVYNCRTTPVPPLALTRKGRSVTKGKSGIVSLAAMLCRLALMPGERILAAEALAASWIVTGIWQLPHRLGRRRQGGRWLLRPHSDHGLRR